MGRIEKAVAFVLFMGGPLFSMGDFFVRVYL